ncbi:MAG: hypothetical protein IPP57_20415 [Candidatus Obscuribacter sp.]|nr:hypothetical protein [Candidatus Obscuribacter sp.]
MQTKTLILSAAITVLTVQICLSPIAHSEPVSVLVAQAPNKSAKAASEQAASTKSPSIQPSPSHGGVHVERRVGPTMEIYNLERNIEIDLPPPKFYLIGLRLQEKVAFDAQTEFTLARCAVQENQPEKAENYFKGTIETLKTKEHDPKFEKEVYEAYAAFLKSEHRPEEAKAILEQLRAKRARKSKEKQSIESIK